MEFSKYLQCESYVPKVIKMCDRKTKEQKVISPVALTLQERSSTICDSASSHTHTLWLFLCDLQPLTTHGKLTSGSNNISQVTHFYLPLCRPKELHCEYKIMKTENRRKSKFTPKMMVVFFILSLFFEVDLNKTKNNNNNKKQKQELTNRRLSPRPKKGRD